MIRPIVCTAQPHRKSVIRYKLKESIRNAQLICLDYEESPQCRVAWDTVDELTRALEKIEVMNATVENKDNTNIKQSNGD
jgi:hypothetical protein